MRTSFPFGRFSILLLALLLTCLSVNRPAASGQDPQKDPQQNNQQRPRRVASPQPTGNEAPATPSQQPSPTQTSSATEEVGEGDVVRVETKLVSVPTVVTNRDGHPVTGLKAQDFVVFEDDKPQRITNFATAEAPFEIALLLD